MADPRWRTRLLALGLAASGVLLLLYNLGLVAAYSPIAQLILATVCGLAAGVLFAGFIRARQDWWRLIPAWTLVALGGMILSTALPAFDPRLSAALLFLGLAIAFGHIYLLDRHERWWALIPAGFMLVLGVVIGLSGHIAASELLAAILFAGMGGVFFALYFLGDRNRQWWALMPGTVLLVFGALAVASGQAEAGVVATWWPVVLIGFAVLVWSAPAARHRTN